MSALIQVVGILVAAAFAFAAVGAVETAWFLGTAAIATALFSELGTGDEQRAARRRHARPRWRRLR